MILRMNTIPSPFDGLSYAKSLPTSPGVYRMFGAGDLLLYVGKAKNLQKRVSSYFQKIHDDRRIQSLVHNIQRMEVIVVPTEVDALILESRLIKSDKPKYNVALRDDRGYPYLHLSTDDATPRLRIHYGSKGKSGRYFGPFPSSDAVHQALDVLQRHFKLRSCSDVFFANRSRPCLEYQIGRCSAPCVGKISAPDYAAHVKEVEMVLDGKSDRVIKTLLEDMERASAQLNFERAATLRDHIQSIRHIQSKISVEAKSGDLDVFAVDCEQYVVCVAICHVRAGKVVGSKTFRLETWETEKDEILVEFVLQYIQDPSRPLAPCLVVVGDHDQELLHHAIKEFNPEVDARPAKASDAPFVKIATATATAAVQSARASANLQEQRVNDLVKICHLDGVPQRIECYDISHTQGEETVASCVVAGPKGMIKSAYRRYNISGITPGDDYAAMTQVLTRRFGKPENLPQLLLIDGGLGQVERAQNVLKMYDLDIPVVGVSKGPARKAGEETLVLAHTGELVEPGPHSRGLHFIQTIRDEAHRFAIEGHRKKRDKRMVRSTLEDIPGLGAHKRKALLALFGGLSEIASASVEDLMKVPGVGKYLAQKIHDHLSKS